MLSTGTGTFIRVLICAQATERLLDGCPNMSSFRKNLTGKRPQDKEIQKRNFLLRITQ